MTRHAFHPARIEITRMSQVLTSSASASALARVALVVELRFSEATDGSSVVRTLTIESEVNDPQAQTPKQATDRLLDIIVHQIARERAGIRPGTRSPEELLAAVRTVLGLPQPAAEAPPQPGEADG